MTFGGAEIPLPELRRWGEVIARTELAAEDCRAVQQLARFAEKVAYVCSDDIDDYILLPLIWNMFGEVAVIRQRNATDAAAFLADGWTIIARDQVGVRALLNAVGSEHRLGPRHFAFSSRSGKAVATEQAVHVATSGTTGRPRYVKLPKAKLIANAIASHASFGALESGAIIPRLSLGSSYGLVMQVLMPCLCGMPVDVDLLGRIANPLVIGARRERSAMMVLSPLQLRSYLLQATDIAARSLTLFCGGDFLHPHTVNLCFQRECEARIFHTYGLTQLGPRVSTRRIEAPLDEGTIGEVGDFLRGVRLAPGLRTIDPRAYRGAVELVIETPFGGRFYSDGERYRDQDSDVASTGDEGYLGADGKVRVFGRLDCDARSAKPLRRLEDFALSNLPLLQCDARFSGTGDVLVRLRPRPGRAMDVKDAADRWRDSAMERILSPGTQLGIALH